MLRRASPATIKPACRSGNMPSASSCASNPDRALIATRPPLQVASRNGELCVILPVDMQIIPVGDHWRQCVLPNHAGVFNKEDLCLRGSTQATAGSHARLVQCLESRMRGSTPCCGLFSWRRIATSRWCSVREGSICALAFSAMMCNAVWFYCVYYM